MLILYVIIGVFAIVVLNYLLSEVGIISITLSVILVILFGLYFSSSSMYGISNQTTTDDLTNHYVDYINKETTLKFVKVTKREFIKKDEKLNLYKFTILKGKKSIDVYGWFESKDNIENYTYFNHCNLDVLKNHIILKEFDDSIPLLISPYIISYKIFNLVLPEIISDYIALTIQLLLTLFLLIGIMFFGLRLSFDV